MQSGDVVRLNTAYQRIVNQDMAEWIDNNKGRKFCVEKVIDNSIKLYKVEFWITEDLLQIDS